jgi:hypothetical protein
MKFALPMHIVRVSLHHGLTMTETVRRALLRAGTLHEYLDTVVLIARLRVVKPWTDDDFNALTIACRTRNALVTEALAKYREDAA